ncbi:MAG: tRNA pseudouridine(38-40) synthase TruA [Verrucomicrobiota bacterium]|nr:tRNA pseudouridine(38-40) synthase TruA [Verrucomicrobiota bacterium]
MPRRLKFTVAYDGRPFAGWQSQANGNTIQDVLEQAFARVDGGPLRVHGSGRTDAGVHALAQTAHADVARMRLTPQMWTAALNDALPATIRIVRSAYVSDAFHARFSAKGKMYRYRIWNDRYLSPLEDGRAWHVAAPLDLARLTRDAQRFVGEHDFAGFAANRGRPEQSTIRTIHSARVRQRGRLITLEFAGDGFLYKMVRLMVGALVRAAREEAWPDEISARLAQPAVSPSQARPAAPAAGLYLVRVFY